MQRNQSFRKVHKSNEILFKQSCLMRRNRQKMESVTGSKIKSVSRIHLWTKGILFYINEIIERHSEKSDVAENVQLRFEQFETSQICSPRAFYS